MNYVQAEGYLNGFLNYENVPGGSYISPGYSLGHVEELLHQLGEPHLAAKAVHIAGTKGKGSVSAMIAQVLTVSGYRTGLYTSPHLHNLRERIRVKGTPISEEDFAGLMDSLRPHFEEAGEGRLTFFEALTVLAFAHFREREVEFQVLEVGLGGRLDATNVAHPEVCVITSISRDHAGVLGDSLEEIAHEKAGIIKQGSQVVLSPQPEEVTAVVKSTCLERGAKLVQLGRDIAWRGAKAEISGQTFVLEGRRGTYHLAIPLLGDYQVENAAAAVAALELLGSAGFHISSEDIARGLAQVKWPGRFQVICRYPLIVVDGAHNVAAMGRLVENIKSYFRYERVFLVVGVSADKDIQGIVKEVAVLSPQVIVTRSSHPRAAPTVEIAAEFSRQGLEVEVASDTPHAMKRALSLAGRHDLICVTGSLFIAAEALNYASGD